MDTISDVKQDDREVLNLTWQDIENDIAAIVHLIKHFKKEIHSIYPISRGGYIPAVMLSHRLNIPINTNKRAINKHTMVVDDIEDSGNTMKFFKEWNDNAFRICLVSKIFKDNYCDLYSRYVGHNLWVTFPWEEKMEEKENENRK